MAEILLSASDGYGALTTIWNLDTSPGRSTPSHNDGEIRTVGECASLSLETQSSASVPGRWSSTRCVTFILDAISLAILNEVVRIIPDSFEWLCRILLVRSARFDRTCGSFDLVKFMIVGFSRILMVLSSGSKRYGALMAATSSRSMHIVSIRNEGSSVADMKRLYLDLSLGNDFPTKIGLIVSS